MFLCLAYDSVFLSFLSIPPVTIIKHVSQLATVVFKGDYHCIADSSMSIHDSLLSSEIEDLKIIGRDLKSNNVSKKEILHFLYYGRSEQKLAFLGNVEMVEIYRFQRKIISEDRFLESMVSMMVRKDFCCKNLIETFVHKILASGLYFKYFSDNNFFFNLKYLQRLDKAAIKRKLTLIDVAPAFIFLMLGYFISFVVLILELLFNHKKISKFLNKCKRRKKRLVHKKNFLC